MLRTVNSLNTKILYIGLCNGITTRSIYGMPGTELVRLKGRKRKPPWLPVAKDKLFKVPPTTTLPKKEKEELLRLRNNYKCMMRSIRHHLSEEHMRTVNSQEAIAQRKLQEEEEHEKLMAHNQKENEHIAAIREERLAREWEKEKERIASVLAEKKAADTAAKEKALRIIAETQDMVKNLISRDELEKAILDSIDNPVDYNFAIDPEGNVYHGRFTKTLEEARKRKQHLVVAKTS